MESRACKLGRFRDGQELGPVYKKERKKKKEREKEKEGEGEGEVGKRFGFVTPRGIVFGNYIRITRDACISLVFLFLFLFVRIMTRCTSFPSSPFFFPLRLALKIDPPFDLDLGFFFLSRGETEGGGLDCFRTG